VTIQAVLNDTLPEIKPEDILKIHGKITHGRGAKSTTEPQSEITVDKVS